MEIILVNATKITIYYYILLVYDLYVSNEISSIQKNEVLDFKWKWK